MTAKVTLKTTQRATKSKLNFNIVKHQTTNSTSQQCCDCFHQKTNKVNSTTMTSLKQFKRNNKLFNDLEANTKTAKMTNISSSTLTRQTFNAFYCIANLFIILTLSAWQLTVSQLSPLDLSQPSQVLPISTNNQNFANGLNIAADAVARLCVTQVDYGECLQMSSALNGSLACVKGRDKYDCMKSIIDEHADIVNLNSEELYLAGRLYNLEPFAMEQYNGDSHHFKSVVVINSRAQINSIADLRDKRSCHGSLNSTFGWDVPIGLLLATLTMQPDCRGELQTVSKFFEQSCAPEKLYPNLCASCQNSSLCSTSDEFYGDDGALKCLFQNYGHVAFTSHESVQRFLSASSRLDTRILTNFEYLCLDGSRLPLDSTPCEWAHKPASVFVTGPTKRRHRELFLSFLQQIFVRFLPYKPSWWRMSSFLSDSSRVTSIVAVPKHLQHWDKYLGNFISSIEKPLPGCEPNNVTICARSTFEELKCLDLQKAAFSMRVRPQIECKRQPSLQDCIHLVARRRADLVPAVDMSDLYEAGVESMQQLEPVALAGQQQRSDYALAVVRADSGIKYLYQLAGARSCHAHYGHTASWLAPLAVLTERSLLEARTCNKADQIADYFGGSCAPGSADLRINKYRSGHERLCALCRGESTGGHAHSLAISAPNQNSALSQQVSGDHLHHCERSNSERYFGEAGALRCLVEGAGEVAFLSASALAANTDGHSKLDWARAMPLAMDTRNFRLVCRNGPSMSANDPELCHLTPLPGKVALSTKFASYEEKVTLRRLLVMLADKFAKDRRDSAAPMFSLFAPYHNTSNLLFDDNTAKLIPLQLEASNFDLLVRQHFDPSFQQLPSIHRPSNCKVVVSGVGTGRWQNISTLLLIYSSSLLLVVNVQQIFTFRRIHSIRENDKM